MSTEANKAAVRRLIEEVWNRGNVKALREMVSPGYVRHDPQSPPVDGRDELEQIVEMYRSAFPDLHFTIDDMIAEGDRVATRWTGFGTQHGDLPDIPASHRPSTVTGTTIARFDRNRIAEEWVHWDTLGMLQNLGMTPWMEQVA